MTCQQCAVGYYLVQPVLNQTIFACAACGNGCVNCTNEDNCIICSLKYYRLGTICLKCIDPYCFGCGPTGQCESFECDSIAFYNTSSSQCQLCSTRISNCNACTYTSNTFSCTGCSNGYYISSSAPSATCLLCPEYCNQCTGPTMCTNCTLGAFLNTTTSLCQPCSTGCR